MLSVFVDGGERHGVTDERKTKAASGDMMQVARGTDVRASMTVNGGCLECAAANPAGEAECGAPDTCQALCDAASQRTPDAAI